MPTFLVTLLIILFANVANAQIVRSSYLVTAAPLRTHTIEDVERVVADNPKFRAQFVAARNEGYYPMMKNWGADEYEAVAILIQNDAVNTPEVRAFLRGILENKRKLMKIYNLKNSTFNKLAAMALGIYGNESSFGKSVRYTLKEKNQDLVVALKYLSGDSTPVPSRGGTQIKQIPTKVSKHYPHITPDTLYVPENSAIATMGFLVETFEMLLYRSKTDRIKGAIGRAPLTYIQPENVYDYIPYVYSGQMRKLFLGREYRDGATVVNNTYINRMKSNMANFYFMSRK